MTYAKQQIQRAISCLDLTLLDEQADAAAIEQLCERAITPLGPVAAVCIYPQFISLARDRLKASSVTVATVINFPEGKSSLAQTLTEIESALAAGAQELDIVIPYHYYLAGQRDLVQPYLTAWRQACPRQVSLKLILETGELKQPELITAASEDGLAAGADFLKTSTGKTPNGASLEAAKLMLTAIKNQQHGGLKLSGGVRTTEQALAYLELADKIMGSHWVQASSFRLGASVLLDDLLQQ